MSSINTGNFTKKTWFDKLLLLISKNRALQFANPINTGIIILSPIILFLFSQVTYVVTDKGQEDVAEIRYPELELTKPNVTKIYFAPDNAILNRIMTKLSREFRSTPILKAFNNSLDMENDLVTEDIFLGIEFGDHLRNMKIIPNDIKVALRFPWQLRSNREAQWPAGWYKENFWEREPIVYDKEGFLFIQKKLSELIILAKNKSAILPQIVMQPFPNNAHRVKLRADKAYESLIFVFSLFFMGPSMIFGQTIVSEKQRYIRDIMRFMGLPIGLNWLSWFIVMYIMLTIPVVVILIMMKLFLCYYSSTLVLFLTFVVYLHSLISMIFVICAFSSNSLLAMMTICLAHILSFIPYVALSVKNFSVGRALLISIFLNSAMPLIFKHIHSFESQTIGIQWSNFFDNSISDELSYGGIVFVMLASGIVRMICFLYVDQINTGRYREAKKWYFPFTLDFWNTLCVRRKANFIGEEENMGMGRKSDIAYFEEKENYKPAIVETRNLSKSYGQKEVVCNFNLKFYEDEITVLLGHNGAGKTTIFMMMAGLYLPTSGQVLINGIDPVVSPGEVRQNLSLCPQNNVFFEELGALWHITFYSRLKGYTRFNAEQEAYRYLKMVNLTERANTSVKNLSPVMRRKLSLCCALCAGSKVVLFDELYASLDPAASRGFWDLLRVEKAGRCIILSTHHLETANVLADRIAVISNGKLFGCGTSDFLINKISPGYRLGCEKLQDCNVSKVTKYLQHKIANVKLEGIVGHEIIYRLPMNSVPQYSELFLGLEKHRDKLKIRGLRVSAPMLSDTLMNVGTESMANETNNVSTPGKLTSERAEY